MLTAAQLRAARGLLDWTRADLAKAAGLSQETIKNIEHGAFRPQESTTDAIVRSFGAHGVEFTENDGVRKAKDVVTTYIGSQEFKKFVDNFYAVVAAIEGDQEVCISGVDDRYFVRELGNEYADFHFSRMTKIEGLKFRALAKHGDTFLPATSYIQYRWFPAVQNEMVPFVVYGDRLAIMIFSETETKVVVVKSDIVANAYRQQFSFLWDISLKTNEK